MVNKEHSQQFITPPIDDDASVEGPRVQLSEENNEHGINHSKNPFSYQPLDPQEPSSDDDQGANLSTTFEEDAEDDVGDQSEGLAQETGGAIGLHLWNELKIGKMVNKEHSQQFISPPIDDDASMEGPRVELSEENNEHGISHSKNPFSYQPLDPKEPSSDDDQGANLGTTFEEDAEDDQSEVSDKAEDCKVKYISEGAWVSKMVVSYFLKGERITQEVRGSGKSVTIPGNATQLEVKFQVMRPFWGDLKKYDRFKRCWCNPDQAHVFKFNTPPPLRTFTISGRLWYEAIMTVSDEYHDETKEM